MEYSQGMAVWLRGDATEPFLGGTVSSVEQDTVHVALTKGRAVRAASPADVFPASGRTASDHCALQYLNEPCVLENTRERYVEDACYTFISDVLGITPLGLPMAPGMQSTACAPPGRTRACSCTPLTSTLCVSAASGTVDMLAAAGRRAT